MKIIINSKKEYLETDILSFKQHQPDSILVIKEYASDRQVDLIRSFYATTELPLRNSHIISDSTDSFFVKSDERHKRKLCQVMARTQIMLFKEPISDSISELSRSVMSLRDYICDIAQDSDISSPPSSGKYYMSTLCHYPIGGGQLEAHTDPYDCVGGSVHGILLLSTKGHDFSTGGLTIRSSRSKRLVDVESIARAGDLVLFDPFQNYHEVLSVDGSQTRDWDKSKGRLSLSCVRVRNVNNG